MEIINPNLKRYDVIIIGGGIIGNSIAYFLSAQKDFSGTIAVIEPDPGHKTSSTGLSIGGIRQQFSTSLNIRISQFAIEFLSEIDEHLTVDGYNPDVQLIDNGYLSLATKQGLETLLENFDTQCAHKTSGKLFYQSGLVENFPFLNVDDLYAGVHGQKDEGWIDPFSFLKRFENMARANGVVFIKNQVVNILKEGDKITSVILQDGEQITVSIVVNAAGSKANLVAEMAGIKDFPVRSRKRFVYVFRSHITLPDCPLVVDPTGVYFSNSFFTISNNRFWSESLSTAASIIRTSVLSLAIFTNKY